MGLTNIDIATLMMVIVPILSGIVNIYQRRVIKRKDRQLHAQKAKNKQQQEVINRAQSAKNIRSQTAGFDDAAVDDGLSNEYRD